MRLAAASLETSAADDAVVGHAHCEPWARPARVYRLAQGTSVINHLRVTFSVLLALALTAVPVSSWALGLGQVEVKSKRDQPLLAEIPIISADPRELEALQARLASPETFSRVGLAPPSGIVSDLQFAVALDARGRPVIRVTSAVPVQQPLLTFLVEVDWGQGRLVREYSALLDTPQTAVAPVQPPIEQATVAEQNTVVRPPEPLPSAADNPLTAAAPKPVPLNAGQPPSPVAADPLKAAAPVAVPLPPAEIQAREPTDAVATAAPIEVINDDTRTVRRGETLGAIAASLNSTNTTGVSLDQTIVALLRANPEAFIGGNANRLKAGAVLRIPDIGMIAGFSADEAAVVMREQMAQWRGAGRALPQPPMVVGNSPEAAAAVANANIPAKAPTPNTPASAPRRAPEARLEIVPASASAAARAATRSGISAGGKGTMLQQQALLETKEALAARSAETDELKARVAELETLKQQQEKLIALKDSELAASQQRLAAKGVPADNSGNVVPWLGVGAGLLMLGALAWWWLRRQPAAVTQPRSFDTERLAAAVPGVDESDSATTRGRASTPVANPAWSRGAKPVVEPEKPVLAEPVGPVPTWHDGTATGAETGPLNPAPAGHDRIDLARAYLDMGDRDTAWSLLREVAAHGDTAAREQATRLLNELK